MLIRSALVGVLIVAIGAGQAAAKAASEPPSAPATRYASIVMDFESGKVLYERNADFARYPASLTKIMTLYLAFEALKAKRITLTQMMKVSEYAAGRDPSRLGLTPGGTLSVEEAIRGMTTKSANDAASVLAEQLGGCEDRFGELMTAKGKALGMSQTVFYNASGLPSPGHISSARDLAVLARALIRDFPEYYHYFSLGDFEYRGKHWGNQNRFLRTYFGADGIKTGFIYSSGHNLAASAVRGQGKRLIAIVLGGDTAGWTREHASRLMDIAYGAIDPNLIVMAAAQPDRAPMQEVAAEEAKPVVLPTLAAGNAAAVPILPSEQAAVAPAAIAKVEQAPASTSPSPATAMLLTTAPKDAKNTQGEKTTASAAAAAPVNVASVQAPAATAVAAAPASSAPKAAPAVVANVAAAQAPVVTAKPAATDATKTAGVTVKDPAAVQVATAQRAPMAPQAPEVAAATDDGEAAIEQGDGPSAAPVPATAANSPEAWSVQVGVFRDAATARQRAEEVREKMPVQLRTAALIVDAIADGAHVSSRFLMINEKDARQACTELQRGRVPCVVIPPGRTLVVATK